MMMRCVVKQWLHRISQDKSQAVPYFDSRAEFAAVYTSGGLLHAKPLEFLCDGGCRHGRY